MSSALLAEIQSLRRDLADLASRVLALEERLSSSAPRAVASPVTVNYSVSGSASYPAVPDLPEFQGFSPGENNLNSGVSAAHSFDSPVRNLAADYSDEERRQVAIGVGAFLRRSLEGGHRGESGRERIKLQSRVYILVRDLQGQVYDPVRVFRSFSALKPLVKEGGQCGDSIFIGLPTVWEAKLSVATAGLQWPADG